MPYRASTTANPLPRACTLKAWGAEKWAGISTASRSTAASRTARRVAPEPQFAPAPRQVDIETLKAVLVNRMHVLRDYSSKVTLPVFRREAQVDATAREASPRLLIRRPQLLDDLARARLTSLLANNQALRTVHEFRLQLAAVWEQANVSNEALVRQLREWCARAEASGIEALQEFSARLREYLPTPGYAA